MFSHVMIGSNDIARSKKFYDAVFAAIGGKPGAEDAKGRLVYAHNGSVFLVTQPIDGKPASHANGGTIGFTVSGPKQADSGTRPGLRTAARRLRTHPVCAKAVPVSCIWRICATPTATSCARCIGCLPEPSGCYVLSGGCPPIEGIAAENPIPLTYWPQVHNTL